MATAVSPDITIRLLANYIIAEGKTVKLDSTQAMSYMDIHIIVSKTTVAKIYYVVQSVYDGSRNIYYPYQFNVVFEIWEKLPDGKDKIAQIIVCSSLDGIILSYRASTILEDSGTVLGIDVIELTHEQAKKTIDQFVNLFTRVFDIEIIELRGLAV
jgi:hypothetical protein